MSVALMTRNDLPPQSSEAERYLLGGVLRDPETIHEIGWLRADDFYHDAHQTIYRTVVALGGERVPIDLVTVIDRLAREKNLENVGGRDYVVDLWGFTAPGTAVGYYAELVRDAAMVRRLIAAANETLRDCWDRIDGADALVAAAERRVMDVASARGTANEPRVAAEFLQDALRSIDDRIAAGGKFTGLATGWIDLDETLGGIDPGDLVVIGARPSVGKTAFAVNALVSIAREKKPVLLFSAEQRCLSIALRMLSMSSGVAMHRFMRAKGLTSEEAGDLNYAASDSGIGGCPFYIEDTASPTAARIGQCTRRLIGRFRAKKDHPPLACIAVDYLQLLEAENTRESKHNQIGTLALRMKMLARELGIPIILLSQLSRDVEQRGGKPRLSDLKESGDIEAHADRVILLHRDPGLAKEQPIWPIEIGVAKNRNGPVDDHRLLYRKAVMRFENAARGDS